MTESMTEILAKKSGEKFATDHGTDIHRQLQFLHLTDDTEIAKRIKSNPELAKFWGPYSRAEVPIAGFVSGKFYSKRIDRLVYINDEMGKNILFIDYKTDTNRARREDYENTMKLYATLLRTTHPDCHISGFILWLNSWQLEKIVE